jgi:hypothetical protein
MSFEGDDELIDPIQKAKSSLDNVDFDPLDIDFYNQAAPRDFRQVIKRSHRDSALRTRYEVLRVW